MKIQELIKALKEVLEKEPIYEMSNAFSDDETNTNVWVENPNGRNNRYFKLGNSTSYRKAKKMIRISLDSAKYEYHKNDNGAEDWNLSEDEKQMLVNLLQKQSKIPGITNWQRVLGTYNQDNYQLDLFDWINEDYDKNKYPDIYSLDTPMPDYTKLIFDKKKAKNLHKRKH